MNIKKKHLGKMITAVLCFAFAAGITGMTAFSADSSNDTEFLVSAYESAEYTVNIQLLQFGSDELSMGNASMIPEAHIVVSDDGTAQLEIDMVSLTYLGQEGYLGWMKKVTNVIETNRFNYPLDFETEDALVLEEYVDVYDVFNDPESEYCNAEMVGKWYPKKLAIPVDFEKREDEILVQVYVPIMESIQTGSGTKFAVIDIDWDTLTKVEAEALAGDVNADGLFTAADVVMLQEWLLAVPDTELSDWKAADLCKDNQLNVFDLCLMKQMILNEEITEESTEETTMANTENSSDIIPVVTEGVIELPFIPA